MAVVESRSFPSGSMRSTTVMTMPSALRCTQKRKDAPHSLAGGGEKRRDSGRPRRALVLRMVAFFFTFKPKPKTPFQRGKKKTGAGWAPGGGPPRRYEGDS